MKRLLLGIIGLSAVILYSYAFLNVSAATVSSVAWVSAPTTLTENKAGTYKFTVNGSGTLSGGDCMLNAVFSNSQSEAALRGSGSVSGKTVTVDYGSAGFSALMHSDVTLPATFTLNLKNSTEVQPTNTKSVTTTLFFYCGGVSSSTKKITIKDACYGKTCGCGSLPACPKVTPKPTVAVTTLVTPTVTPILVKMPTLFLENGSNSTKLDSLTAEQLKKITGLVLEVAGKNKIIFMEDVDLSGINIGELDKLVVINGTAEVFIDSEKSEKLNKPARITMSGLKFSTVPTILRNGGDSSGFVDNVRYDSATGVLEFEVTGFSTYKAVEASTKLSNNIDNTLLLGIGVATLIILITGGVFVYRKKARKVI